MIVLYLVMVMGEWELSYQNLCLYLVAVVALQLRHLGVIEESICFTKEQ